MKYILILFLLNGDVRTMTVPDDQACNIIGMSSMIHKFAKDYQCVASTK